MKLNKNKIKNSFSRRAGEYDKTAQLQQSIASELIKKISVVQPGNILDIGCGTGFLTKLLAEKYPEARICALDLAPGMIEQAKKKLPQVEYQIADAEALPYPDQSFNGVFSSATYQWLDNPQQAFQEAGRVLKGDGLFAFSMFGGKTLYELRDSYRQAFNSLYPEHSVPLHDYVNFADLFTMLEDFTIINLTKQITTTIVPDLNSLLKLLKSWGARNAHPAQLPGLGKRKLLKLTEELYQRNYFTTDNENHGLNVTWEVFYAKVMKKI
ncbi:methyltransferase domain-containing protein [Candidatus Margulisiibacteriota bacterium]